MATLKADTANGDTHLMTPMLATVTLRAQSDRRLAALAGTGGERAFEVLLERHRRAIHSYCRRLLGEDSRGEDAVQLTFVLAWRAFERGVEVQDVRAWLYRIAHNATVDMLRRSGQEAASLDDSISVDPTADFESRAELRSALVGMAALPDLQREALVRTALRGDSHDDVARALGVSDGAVRGLVYRARATLRAGASALTPWPLTEWAAGRLRGSTPALSRVAELTGGGGAAGLAGILIKGGSLAVTAGVIAGGAALAPPAQHDRVSAAASAPVAASVPVADLHLSRGAANRSRSSVSGAGTSSSPFAAGRAPGVSAPRSSASTAGAGQSDGTPSEAGGSDPGPPALPPPPADATPSSVPPQDGAAEGPPVTSNDASPPERDASGSAPASSPGDGAEPATGPAPAEDLSSGRTPPTTEPPPPPDPVTSVETAVPSGVSADDPGGSVSKAAPVEDGSGPPPPPAASVAPVVPH